MTTSERVSDGMMGGTRSRRSLPYLVLILLVSGTVMLAGVVSRVVDDQERRLLEQQASAASALVSSGFGSVTSTLPLLGALADPGLGGEELFSVAAQAMVRDG